VAFPTYKRTFNVRASFSRVIGTSLAVTTTDALGAARVLTVPVIHNFQWADPDGRLDPSADPDQAWVALTWVADGAGRHALSIAQFDVYVRTGLKTDADADPYGIQANDTADAIETLFAGERADTTHKGWIPMYDYAVPSAPVAIGDGACLQILDPAKPGSWGLPLERTPINGDPRYQRIVLRYGMRFCLDALAGHNYRARG